MKKFHLLSLSFLLLLFSCTVDKRLYNKGYHLTKNEKLSTTSKVDKANSKEIENKISNNDMEEENLLSQQNSEILESPLLSKLFKQPKDNCDVIYFKDGTEVKASIIEISDHAIQYKKCNSENQVVFSTSSDNILMIVYSNGEKFVPKQNTSLERKTTTTESQENTKQNTTQKLREHPLGIISIALGGLGFVLAILGIYVVFYSVYTGGGLLIVAAFLLAIAALITGIIGLVKSKRYKDRFKGSVLSIIGLSLGALLLGLLIFISIFLIIAAIVKATA